MTCRPGNFAVPLPSRSRLDLPIGVFDSGVGGLTVAAALRRRLPSEHLLYLGDIARQPYGTKTSKTVARYALQAARFLERRRVKMLVVACNTASAHALEALVRAHPGLPIVGVVEAGARAAASRSPGGGIVVAATEGTCASGAFPRAIRALRPEARVTQVACPLFVALAEEGFTQGPIAEAVVKDYLGRHFADGAGNDTLLLGCTHFPLLAPALGAALGDAVNLVDCGEAVAAEAAGLLAAYGLAAPAGAAGGVSLLATEAADRLARLGGRLLAESGDPPKVELVDL